jgi:hypothetical protein
MDEVGHFYRVVFPLPKMFFRIKNSLFSARYGMMVKEQLSIEHKVQPIATRQQQFRR